MCAQHDWVIKVEKDVMLGQKSCPSGGLDPTIQWWESGWEPRSPAAVSCVGEYGNCDKHSPERLPWQEGGKSIQERDMTGSQEVAWLPGIQVTMV